MEHDEQTVLYIEQMKHWFKEQETLGEQLMRAVDYHERMAQLNRQQLALHEKRIQLGTDEYNRWADDKGVDRHPPTQKSLKN